MKNLLMHCFAFLPLIAGFTACGSSSKKSASTPNPNAAMIEEWTGYYEVSSHTENTTTDCKGKATDVKDDDAAFQLTPEAGYFNDAETTIMSYYSCAAKGDCDADSKTDRSLYEIVEDYWTGHPSLSSSGFGKNCLMGATTTEGHQDGTTTTITIKYETAELTLDQECVGGGLDLEAVYKEHKAEYKCESLETIVATKK